MKDNMPLYILAGIILGLGAIAFYFLVTDGTVACMFAEDPFLCSAIDRK